MALENGVDSIEHGAKMDDETIRLYKERGAFVCTTISPALPYALFDTAVSGASEKDQYNGKIVFDGVVESAKTALANGIPVPDSFVSARVMSWMQYDYGISGNLYWETALYRKIRYEGGEMTRTYLDPYTEAEHYPGTNGDGFLFYPGAKYGIYGPVISNRLVAIRDGLEEIRADKKFI